MDNPTTLLVAIMFVTILSIGLSNLLMTLSDIVGQKIAVQPDAVHLSWMLLLFMSYFSYYWETVAILDIEGWTFLSFIGFLIGPILLLFATNLTISLPDSEQSASPREHYLTQSNRFFTMMVGVQAWIIALDFIFDTVDLATYGTAAALSIFAVLIFTNNYKAHVLGNILCWIPFAVRLVAEAT